MALSFPTAGFAAIHSFNFAGEVAGLIADDTDHTFSANFRSGDAVSGSFSFDDASPLSELLPGIKYVPATFTVTISGHAFTGPARYGVFDDNASAGDGLSIINSTYETGAYTGPAIGSLQPSTFFIQFLGMPSSTWTNPGLVTNPDIYWNLSNTSYAPNGFRLDHPDGSFGGLYLTVNSVTAVPEPETWAMLLAGLTLTASAARRRHKTLPNKPVSEPNASPAATELSVL